VSAFHKVVSEKRYWSEPLQRPVAGCMTSLFGVQRYQNGVATGVAHGGLDQRGAAGTPVHAVAAGVVKIVRQFDLRGGTVAIDHGQGLASMYLHMSKLAAKEGDVVGAGDVVGYVGSTGRSTAPHLHWSLYVYGMPVNPLQWVRVRPCRVPAKKSV
jgi:murein DD-endopeptidase MepM/ murein hydrolase activator NlpD